MSDVLTLSQIRMPGTARTKDDAIREAGGILVDVGAVTPEYIDSMFDRERSVSTYMGNYLAIPHGTNESKESIKRSALSVIRYPEPIDWDGNEVLFALGLAGYQGGKMAELDTIEYLFVVPSSSVHRIQEAQTTVYHVLWELTQVALAAADGS